METNKQESVAFLCTSVLASFSRETEHSRIIRYTSEEIYCRNWLTQLRWSSLSSANWRRRSADGAIQLWEK